MIAIVVAILFIICRKFFTTYAVAIFRRRFSRSQGFSAWAKAFEKPIGYGFVLIGLYTALRIALPLQIENAIELNLLFRSSLIVLIGFGIYNVSATSSMLLEQLGKRFGLDHASMLIPFLSKTIRFVIILLVVTIVGSEWGFSINGVVAGMGLGSLAIALAAKETLSNVFGGIVIIAERPFAKGDWILTPSAEGVVEDITFRSTRIRTFADSLVTVPNSTLANHPITNWSKMGKRRVTFTLKVALETDRVRLATAIGQMERMLRENEHVDPGTIMVRFNEFQEGGLGIFFYYFTKTTVWSDYLTIRQELNLAIMGILEDEGIRMAYPAQRIFMESNVAESSYTDRGVG
ncbi:mechanosensitive ion channel family protein [Paenibacillus sp. MWE-103]|uniref:Mechanosensitive ion channel family protein n=1 Tax=Paenibacillus artemisiicola TaxID=1172618 RepID=A0ABS3WBQ7_9BACL|nr:mechanosensitive ion channel family protein [Paenibacillus artemisiicola]MBO7745744.1 mechanosensitive ion channel family protein [Paenibacillus artemisiicola]